jgi:hypothetical protein
MLRPQILWLQGSTVKRVRERGTSLSVCTQRKLFLFTLTTAHSKYSATRIDCIGLHELTRDGYSSVLEYCRCCFSVLYSEHKKKPFLFPLKKSVLWAIYSLQFSSLCFCELKWNICKHLLSLPDPSKLGNLVFLFSWQYKSLPRIYKNHPPFH